MPLNGSGTFVPAGSSVYPAVTTTTISSTDFDALIADVVTALSTAIYKDGQSTPTANIPMGGFKLTGLAAGSATGNSLRYEQLFTTSNVALLGAMDWVKGADISSASTINLSTATGNAVHVTGTTAITAVTLGSGMWRQVIFDGALTLTHHTTNNNLPGAANITTAAGDRALYWSDGTTVYCMSYFPANGILTGQKNLVINATCQVTTRGDLGITTNLSTSRGIGSVDRIGVWASGGAVSAGTITAGTDIGVASVSAKSAGTTLTGAGVISASYRMRAADAKKYKNTTMSFSVTVSHDVGSNVNYTLVVLKPTVSDDYTSRTTISTATAVAVSTGIGTGTRLTFNGVSVGDVTNGLELEVQAACGAVTTKNMEFTDWQFELGSSATPFERHRYEDDALECAVYLPFYKSSSSTEEVGVAQSNSSNQQTAFVGFSVTPRIAPTGVTVSSAAHFQGSDAGNAGKALNSVTFSRASSKGCSLVLAATATPWTAGQMGYLQAVSASGYLLFTGAEL